MARILVFFATAAVILAGADALAGTVETTGGQTYSGAVIGVGTDSLQFAWQKTRDQIDEIKQGDSDRAFQAEGDEAVTMSFAMSELSTVNGVPPATFKVLYGSNLFYRLVQTMDRGRVQAMSGGDFIVQVKGVAVLLLTLCLLMPVLMILIARILPGQQIGFLGGIGYSVLLFCVGLALATGCSLLTAAVPFFASSALQYILSAVLVALVALVVHVATSHSFWQGLGFVAVWAAAMALGARVAIMLLSSGLVGQAIT